jgi:alcohol dehydrogenase class IV
MESLGARRALVVCGRTVAGGEMLARVTAALGTHCAGVYDGVTAHSPVEKVREAARQLDAIGADTVISVGGGSAIDAGKGIALERAAGHALESFAIDFASQAMARPALPDPGIRHIAVPTTAGSASDVMPTAGIRDPASGIKLLFWDDRLVPDATVLDPEMAVYAGPELSAATGVTALARAIEGLYSSDRNPLSTGLAVHAIRLLGRALPRVIETPDDLAARADCQMACLMSGTAAMNAMASVVHAIGHIVGGRYALQHGTSHAILLGPAMRRLLPAIGADLAIVLEALGADPRGSASDAADRVEGLLAALPLRRRLRDVGVEEDALPEIAAATMDDYMMPNLPAPMTEADVLGLLEEGF